MRRWTESLDIATIPDQVLYAEVARRRAAKRVTMSGGRNGGRPKKLTRCERCGREFGAVEMRKHRAQCAG